MKKKTLWLLVLVVIGGTVRIHAQSNPFPGLQPLTIQDFPHPDFPDDPPSTFDDSPYSDPFVVLFEPFLPPVNDQYQVPDPPQVDDPLPMPSHINPDIQRFGHYPVLFTPEPLPLPFFPSFASGTNSTVGPCDPTRDTRIFIPDLRGQVDVLGTCPERNVQTIPLRFHPNGLRVDRDGTVLIATSLDSPEGAIIDAATYSVSDVGLTSANGDIFASSVAFSADGSLAYIANHSASNPFVAIFDMASRRVTTTLTGIGPFPGRLAVSPDGSMLWVSCRGDSTIHVFDTLTNTKIAVFNVIEPLGIAFNPTGTLAFVAAANDFAPGTIDVFDAEKLTKITSIPTGFVPENILISPTGRDGFVNNLNSSFVTQFDPVRLTFVQNIDTKAPVSGIGFIRR